MNPYEAPPGKVEAKKPSRSEEIQMRRQKIESLQREVEELQLDENKSEIEKNKARIQEIRDAEKAGTLSSLYNYSSSFGDKANEEVVALENKIRELEGSKKKPEIKSEIKKTDVESGDKSEKEFNFESNEEYRGMLEDECLRWLKNDEDARAYFLRSRLTFDRSADGYLIDFDGKETNTLPSQIDPAEINVAEKVKADFLARHPEFSKKGGESLGKDKKEKPAPQPKSKETIPSAQSNVNEKDQKGILENEAEVEKLEKEIKKAESFEALIKIIQGIEATQGSPKWVSKNSLLGRIYLVQAGEMSLDAIPEKAGLREKVKELMEKSGNSDNKNEQAKPGQVPNIEENPKKQEQEGEKEKVKKVEEKKETMSIEMKKAIDNLNAMRMCYMLENKKYMEGRKTQGLIGGLWQKLRGIKPEPEPELPQELLASKENLKLAKIELGKQMMKEEKERLEGSGLSPEEVKKNLEVFKTKDVFEKLILDEQIILEKFRQESFPPKEHGIFVKALQWYGKQNRITKLAVGTMAAAGGAAIGGMSAPAAALFAGSHLVRAALATGLGLVGGKVFTTLVKDKSDENFEKSSGDIRNNFGVGELDVEKAATAYRSASETKDKEKNKYNLAKNLVIAATAAWANVGLSSLESYLSKPIYAGVDDQTILKGQSAPTPKLEEIDAATIPPAPPASIDFTHVVGPRDNMWTILRADMSEHVPGFSSLSRAAQNNAVGTLWQEFVHADPSQLKAIGIVSGDPHILATGAKINIGGLVDQGMMDKAFSHASSLSSAKLIALQGDMSYMKGFKGIMREPYVNAYLNSRR